MALVAKTNIELDDPLREKPTTVNIPVTRRGTNSTHPNPNDGERETQKMKSGSSQMEKLL